VRDVGIREEMPLLARHEGEWEGTYTFVNPAGEIIDRHRSHLTCAFPDDDEEFPYRQTNRYAWEDGRTEEIDFPGMYKDGKLYFDTERINGYCWEVDDHCIVLTWRYQQDPSVTLYELIHLDESGNNRSRTWQWFKNGVCFQRTLIDEKRVK
jgi:hypothetical protein